VTPPQKHQGTTTIKSFTDSDFSFLADPSQTCIGDSGGAAFIAFAGAEYLVGITSSGDIDCVAGGQDMRVDANLEFLASVMAQAASETPDAGCAAAGPHAHVGTLWLASLLLFLRPRSRRVT